MIALIQSFAATALIPSSPKLAVIIVPFASGCMVFKSLTGMFLFCAGKMQVGCKNFAPKQASSAASSND
jgi:hypothetical protein